MFKHPHILLLQVRNCIFKLPGGRLRPGELGKVICLLVELGQDLVRRFFFFFLNWDLFYLSEIDGLKRKLSRKLCVNADGDGIVWEVQNNVLKLGH